MEDPRIQETVRRIDPMDGEAVARRGEELYEAVIRGSVEADRTNLGRLVIVDVESGDNEVDDSGPAASPRLRRRRPSALMDAKRIGDDAAYPLHGALVRTEP